MRITGGISRGIHLKSPPDNVRPATDRMRQAVFSSMGTAIEGASVLDLFAGCGSYGLEAISRGASRCHFVDNNRLALVCLKKNLEAVEKCLGERHQPPPCKVSRADVFSWKPGGLESFDFVFMDPPYSLVLERWESLFALAQKCLSVNPASRLVFEMPGDFDPKPEGWEIIRRLGSKKAGEPAVGIYKLSQERLSG